MQTQEMTAPPRAPADGAAERFQAKLAYEIAPAELKSVLDSLPDSICLVDVRDAQAYDEGHIPLAVNIPLFAASNYYFYTSNLKGETFQANIVFLDNAWLTNG